MHKKCKSCKLDISLDDLLFIKFLGLNFLIYNYNN